MSDDVTTLRRKLSGIESAAKDLRWADKRPWKVKTHVFWESEVPTIDGHDLNAKLMKRTLSLVVDHADSLDTGAIRIITGRGTHSVGKGVLGEIVKGTLAPRAADRGWRLRPNGPGAYALIVDTKRAPSSVTGDSNLVLWLLLLTFSAAAAAAVAHAWGWF